MSIGLVRPWQDSEIRPLPPPAGGLGLVDMAGREHRVGPDHEVEHVREAVRRIDPPPSIMFQPDAEAGRGRLERVNSCLRGGMRRAPNAELLLIPQVDAGLVAD